jgi:hypothetical protein
MKSASGAWPWARSRNRSAYRASDRSRNSTMPMISLRMIRLHSSFRPAGVTQGPCRLHAHLQVGQTVSPWFSGTASRCKYTTGKRPTAFSGCRPQPGPYITVSVGVGAAGGLRDGRAVVGTSRAVLEGKGRLVSIDEGAIKLSGTSSPSNPGNFELVAIVYIFYTYLHMPCIVQYIARVTRAIVC